MKIARSFSALIPGIFLFCLRASAQIAVGDTLTTQVGAPDTLSAGVAEWDKGKQHATKYGESRDLLSGATHGLSLLDIQAHVLLTGKTFLPAANERADHLLIVKEGSLTVTIGASRKVLGPGGVGLFAAGENPVLLNTGTANASFYLFSLRGKNPAGYHPSKQGTLPVLLDWSELTVKKTDKGESRPIFSCPVAWLQRIDMHATTLNAGQISHPPHVHRAEEIILMRSGHVRLHIGGAYGKAQGGDIVYLASGVPHNLENGDEGPCEYYAVQWEP